MTIHFVGEIEKTDLPGFKAALDEAAAGIPPFDIRFTSFGSFRQGRQDLIYVKTKHTGDYLQIMAYALKNSLKCGDTKALKPHITMVRRAEMKHSTLKVIKKQRLNLPPVKIKSIELMESVKREGRLVYVPLYSCSLG
jgi:2'-5' RNA ligase